MSNLNPKQSLVSGWGRNTCALSKVISFQQFIDLTPTPTRGFIPRGLGRSYGDSASNSGGYCIRLEGSSEHDISIKNGVATCAATITIGELERFALSNNYFPRVVPGTEFVTIGGAIASDIHGKSHHKVGSFSRHVSRIKLLTKLNSIVELYPFGPTSELFWATCGGMGLTGLILEADIELREVKSSFVDVREFRASNLNEIVELMDGLDSSYEYSVAWIDLSGDFIGRGRVSFANHSDIGRESRPGISQSDRITQRKSFRIPFIGLMNFITPVSTRLFNTFWYLKPLANGTQEITKYMHPLDPISNWNLLYGKSGFVQYQFVIPAESLEKLQVIFNILRDSNVASPLGVLKKLGAESGALLGFSMPGWTLAIDVPAKHKNLEKILEQIDEIVIAARGRIYLTKDSRVSRLAFKRMYLKLEEFLRVKSDVDPETFWISDQFRRLMQ
jgi:decaprenylphospho-beta-D-ribofuranose 2-oxidase